MKLILFILILGFSNHLYSQTDKIVFDKSNRLPGSHNEQYYSRTDFSIIDTVDLWKYDIDTTFHGDSADSVKPLGRIFFFRASPIIDTYRKKIYAWDWIPYMSFRIFSDSDSSYCFSLSGHIRLVASCFPPETGGDIIQVGRLILVNNRVCTNCLRFDLMLDNCRPVLNYILSKVSFDKVSTIDDLANQLIIKKGSWTKDYD